MTFDEWFSRQWYGGLNSFPVHRTEMKECWDAAQREAIKDIIGEDNDITGTNTGTE